MARRTTQEHVETDVLDRRPSRITQVVLEVERSPLPPYVHGCIIPNAEGRAAGVPEYGDRASWRTDYDDGATHADDWAPGDSHHREVTLGAGSAEELTLDGQELTLAEVLTPTEHTAIGDASPHHAAVTLGADAGAVLGLTGQQIDLDAQSANVVLAGPASGAAAAPTFRALTADDLPMYSSFGHILLVQSTGETVDYGVASSDNLNTALGSALSGDVVWLPACSIDGDHVVPDGVSLHGLGRTSVLTGQITLGGGSEAIGIHVSRSVADAEPAFGICSADDEGQNAYVNNCVVSVINTTGQGYAVTAVSGNLHIQNSRLAGSTSPILEVG